MPRHLKPQRRSGKRKLRRKRSAGSVQHSYIFFVPFFLAVFGVPGIIKRKDKTNANGGLDHEYDIAAAGKDQRRSG